MHIRRWGVASSGLDPLLNRIARNLLIDRYRRIAPHLVPLDSADEIQDPSQDPTEEVARRQRRSAVRSAIRSLPTRHQTAITYSLSGLTPEEVGKQMGIGRNAADALLHRARRSLREHLAPVRDGMWGVALGIRVRWDRLTRRAGVESGLGEVSHLAALQSAITVATAAVVSVLTVTGGAMPATAASLSNMRRVSGYAVAPHSLSNSSGGAASGGSGFNGSGGSSNGTDFAFGGLAGGSLRPDGSDARVEGPRDPKSGRPLVWIEQHQYGRDGPTSDPMVRAWHRLCRSSSESCVFLEGPNAS